jgi:hypothetical protein
MSGHVKTPNIINIGKSVPRFNGLVNMNGPISSRIR